MADSIIRWCRIEPRPNGATPGWLLLNMNRAEMRFKLFLSEFYATVQRCKITLTLPTPRNEKESAKNICYGTAHCQHTLVFFNVFLYRSNVFRCRMCQIQMLLSFVGSFLYCTLTPFFCARKRDVNISYEN